MSKIIPRIIHQIWLGPLKPPQDAMDSWKQKHSGWEYLLWTEDNLPELVNNQAFLDSDNFPQKADILRYEILQQFGGVYMDADVYCLKPIDDLYEGWVSQGVELIAAIEGSPDRPDLVANTFIAAAENHHFIVGVVNGIDVSKEGGAWEITGPQYFTDCIKSYKPEIKLLSSTTFFPIHHANKECRLIDLEEIDKNPDVYGVHLWTGTKRAYEPLWYKSPFSFLFLQLRKSLNKTFQIKPKH